MEPDDLDARLAPVPPPAGLEEALLARLEREGLIGDPPANLLERTLGRLEEEGLVRPPARRRWVVAAALLLGAGLGWLARAATATPVEVERPVERVIERVIEQPVVRLVEKQVVVERPVVQVVERQVVVERPVVQLVEKPSPSYLTDGPLEQWLPVEGRWRSVAPGAHLPPGEIVRGTPRTAHPLARVRACVVSARGELVPIPTARDGSRVGAPPRETTATDDGVRALIAQLASGAPPGRARARAALENLRQRLGPGRGPSVLGVALTTARAPTTPEEWARWWAAQK